MSFHTQIFVLQYLKERFQINMPHRFKKAGFMSTGFCDLCGQLIIMGQGRKCSAPGKTGSSCFCGMVLHASPVGLP